MYHYISESSDCERGWKSAKRIYSMRKHHVFRWRICSIEGLCILIGGQILDSLCRPLSLTNFMKEHLPDIEISTPNPTEEIPSLRCRTPIHMNTVRSFSPMRYVSSFSSQEHQAPISTAASSTPHYKNAMMTSTRSTPHFRMYGEIRVRSVSYSSIGDLPKSQSTWRQH